METGKYTVRYESINEVKELDKPTLVREDGVSLLLIGKGRENELHFVYADKDRSFKFVASRYEDSFTDKWRVFLGGGLNRLPHEKTPSFEEVRAIADNIEGGLFAWGWYEKTEQTTAKTISFGIKTWRHWSPALGWGGADLQHLSS